MIKKITFYSIARFNLGNNVKCYNINDGQLKIYVYKCTSFLHLFTTHKKYFFPFKDY